MKVSSTQPFQIIYSLLEHEFLGYLFEPFAVQVNSLGKLTLQHQTISSTNANEFKTGLDDTDFQLIKLIDAIQPEAIFKKFGDKKLKPNDFFIKIFDKIKGNEELQDLIENYLEKYKAQILELLHGKKVFEMGNDGEPTWREIIVEEQKATVLFHFYRNETNTHYLPTIKHKGERIEFKYKGAKLICSKPAWLLCEGKLYHFEKDVEGQKLKPFLNKKFIEVPRKIEEEFFKKFGLQLIAQFDVHAEGFEIKLDKSLPKATLVYTELQKVNSTASLFSDDSVDVIDDPEESKMVFELQFIYGEYSFKADNPSPTLVRHEKTEDSFVFYKIKRDLNWEKEKLSFLKSIEFEVINAKKVLSKADSFSWLSMHREALEQQGIEIKQNPKDSKRYFTGVSTIKIEVNENIDWFDIKAIVKFGEYEVPFYFLKGLIIKKQQEFKLPNGEVAVIPQEWFTKYSELFAFIDGEKDSDEHKIKKHHLSLVHELKEDSLAIVTMNRKLENLRNFDQIDHFPLPQGFKGELRPYQHAGYNWLHFLNEYKFGGCLADDMGLGKTVQTLAFLLSQKQNDQQNTSLLVVPTSLVYNWEIEAKKFTPDLKIHLYTGTYREKNVELFAKYDLVITSYGIARMDEELLKKFYFHYIILDESQAIKNPSSNTSKAVRNLSSRFRLILTGTPIENTTLDLWSQMTFINPGLLGTQNFFKEEFLNPIEKKGDELKVKKLYAIIKPFILRRQKTQVAKDLPEKIESIRYSQMSEAQEKLYEETKSYFRNKILEMDTDRDSGQKQIQLLQGLTKLRQIANHPLMIDVEYKEGSGKMEDVFHLLNEAIEGGHKVLIFSQFVKHLSIFRNYLEENNTDYCYIDGSTTNRQEQVDKFQQDESIKLFLISLKAGGVGLNLTAADYVFILDPWWNPAVEAQAVDRAHRIGQKKTVFTYKFITKNSVEEKILLLQNRKKALAGELISNEEGFIKSLSKEDIEMILS
jgi:SNF2 family DNA or RNA helicase